MPLWPHDAAGWWNPFARNQGADPFGVILRHFRAFWAPSSLQRPIQGLGPFRAVERPPPGASGDSAARRHTRWRPSGMCDGEDIIREPKAQGWPGSGSGALNGDS